MRKWTVLFLALSILLSVAYASTSGLSVADAAQMTVYTYGDVNRDGDINAEDALEVLRASAKLIALDEIAAQAADVDGIDGQNAEDALWILQYSARITTSFPVGKTFTASDGNSGNAGGEKTLVAYFSRTGENYSVGSISEGNTAVIAKMIAEETGADLFEIKPVTPYPDNYQEMLAVAQQEANENARPAISGEVSDMNDYDTVFIGYPIWNGDMPKIVYTFLESYDFTGKTVIPFNTHEGSGQAGTQQTIASLLTESTILNGLAVRGSTAQNTRGEARETVCEWLDRLNLDFKAPADSETQTGVFDFALTEDEMQQMTALDKNERFASY